MTINVGQLKYVEVRVKDSEPDYQDDKWDDIYRAVEVPDADEIISTFGEPRHKWVIGFEYGHGLTVYAEEIPHYIALFQAMQEAASE